MTVAEYNLSVEQFADNIYRFILKNIKDTEKAKDIVQDTYEKLWMRVDSVSYEKVRAYLFTTAYHTMIDMIRREKKQVDFEQVNANKFSHTDHYSDVQEIINQAIEKLPPAQKSVILLRDYEGYSYDEIAQITGLSEAQVKVYIYRGRMFLKNYLVNLETLI
ncbi:MAG: RNA polymerase sigma factor [Bacteroidales bacterium]|nr:RNA polymerase sigma factor [Bacteroidales bacterium]